MEFQDRQFVRPGGDHRVRRGRRACRVDARLGGDRAGEADVGHQGADRIVGTAKADVIKARGGNDRIKGRGGKDRLSGGPARIA